MLSLGKNQDKFGLKLEGDFFDLDRLYFAIFKLTGQFGLNSKCPYEGYANVCEYILALCYEIRHAQEGNRGLIAKYNGLRSLWFEDEDDEDWDEDENEDDDYDFDELLEDENLHESQSPKFHPSLLQEITYSNVYFSTDLSITEVMFYAWVLEEVVEQVEVLKPYLRQHINPILQELSDDYTMCEYREDTAIVSMFIAKAWHALYRILGSERFHEIHDLYQNVKKKHDGLIFKDCDLDNMNNLIVSYYEQSPEKDNHDLLMETLSQMLQASQ